MEKYDLNPESWLDCLRTSEIVSFAGRVNSGCFCRIKVSAHPALYLEDFTFVCLTSQQEK